MDETGHRGWIHIEGIKMPLDLKESVRYDLPYLQRVYPQQA